MHEQSTVDTKKTTKASLLLLMLLALVVFSIALLPFSFYCDGNSDEKFIMRSITFGEISQFELINLPIKSSEDAIKHTVKYDVLFNNLKEVSINTEFVRWDISAELRKGFSNMWEVNIRSSRMLPSYSCTVYVNQDGEITSIASHEALCRYNK